MYYYHPPKSSIWGHRLRKMHAARAWKLFSEFLATAAGAYRFQYGSLGCHGVAGNMTAHFERLLGMSARNGHFQLHEEQTRLCLDEIIQHEAAHPNGPRPYLLLQSFTVTQWRIDGQNFATDSMFNMNYGLLPCLSTFLRFDSPAQFESIKRVLEDLGICKLNEKHLKLSRGGK